MEQLPSINQNLLKTAPQLYEYTSKTEIGDIPNTYTKSDSLIENTIETKILQSLYPNPSVNLAAIRFAYLEFVALLKLPNADITHPSNSNIVDMFERLGFNPQFTETYNTDMSLAEILKDFTSYQRSVLISNLLYQVSKIRQNNDIVIKGGDGTWLDKNGNTMFTFKIDTFLNKYIVNYQQDYIRDPERLENLIETANGLSISIQQNILTKLDKYYEDLGFVWNGYYSYINPNHPFMLALSDTISLSPEIFEFCNHPLSIRNGEDFFQEVRKLSFPGLSLDYSFSKDVSKLSNENYNQIESSIHFVNQGYKDLAKLSGKIIDGDRIDSFGHWRNGSILTPSGWTKDKLISSIVAHGLTNLNITIDNVFDLDENIETELKPILVKTLNLSLLTGNPKHATVPLPGFGMKLFEGNDYKESKRIIKRIKDKKTKQKAKHLFKKIHSSFHNWLYSYWHQPLNKGYYVTIYRTLFKTLQYSSVRSLCQLNIDHNQMKRLAAEQFNITKENMPTIDNMTTSRLCNVIASEAERRMSIKASLQSNINEISTQQIIYQPFNIWLMDSMSTIHLFKQEGSKLLQYPDSMLPEDIETLTNLYITSCRNKQDIATGVFVEIIQKLGAGEMLPPNIDTLDKDDLCQIIEELLKYNMSRSQSRYSSYKLPQGYILYNDMVVNTNKYSFDAFYESLDELQLLEAVKLR